MRPLLGYPQALRVSVSATTHNSGILCSNDVAPELSCRYHLSRWCKVCDVCAFTSLRGSEAIYSVKSRGLRGFPKCNANIVGTIWRLGPAS